jgi:hypothetical protein
MYGPVHMHPLSARLGSLGLVVALAACAASGSPSPFESSTSGGTPSAPPASSLESSPSAAASSDATPNAATRPVVQNEGLWTVRVNSLNVRAAAGLSAPVLNDESNSYGPDGKVQLNAGDHVLVISDAKWADGRWWLEIATDRVASNAPAVVGFVAAGTHAAPWVEEDNAFCPGAGPSLTALLSLSGVERLGCYSSTPLSFPAFRATLLPDGLGGACDPGPTHPEWLVCDNINHNWVNRDGGAKWEFLLHFDPAVGISPTGLSPEGSVNPQLQITGHFNDEAALDCAPNPWDTIEDAAAQVTCRTLFVVEQVN